MDTLTVMVMKKAIEIDEDDGDSDGDKEDGNTDMEVHGNTWQKVFED